jgi:glycosyltransferase involved in cell wall biosynthesis
MSRSIRVLTLTAGWPQPGRPQTTHFIKRQVDFLRAAGVDVDVFYIQGKKRPDNYLRSWFRVRPLLTSRRYDLVHAQFGQSGLLALPKRLPLVVTFRGSDLLGIVGPDGRYRKLGRFLQAGSRLVARQADAVILVSEHMKAQLPPSIPVNVIPSGLDLTLFQTVPRDEARQRLGLSSEARLVLFAGDPQSPRKRHWLARAAMAHLTERMPAEMVVAWGVPHADIPAYMNACDALLFTSMQEGSPNVVKEALACNLPVVSVRVGDVSDRLRGIDGCEVCQDEDPKTLAAALERVLVRNERIAGRQAVQDLDERNITQQVIAIYRSVLGRARAPANSSPVAPLHDPTPSSDGGARPR